MREAERTTFAVGSHLTEAGQVFLPQAQALLRSANQAATHTRAAAQPSTITIGYAGNLIVTPAVPELASPAPRRRGAHAASELERSAHGAPGSPGGRGHRPTAVPAQPAASDDPVPRTSSFVVPVFHRLAGEKSVILDDIADEPLPRLPDATWNPFWRIDPRPDERPAPEGPLVDALEDKLELIAGGQAIAIAPAADQSSALRSDLTTVPIEGFEPSQVVLATRANERGRLVTAFREAARTHLTVARDLAPA